MTAVKKMGGVLSLDPAGFILNPCSQEKIQPPWLEVVGAVKSAYLQHCTGEIHSIYLRGSIPRGQAISGISDVDSFAVVREKPQTLDSSWMAPWMKKMKEEFPFVTYFEFRLVGLKDLLNSPGFLSYRFILKCLSLCIYGEDLAGKILPFKPSLRLGFFFHGNIAEILAGVKSRLNEVEDPQKIKEGCAFVMKRILRTGFSLVMEQAGVFTRDLYPCYEIFSKYYPQKEPEMRRALEWAVEPISDRQAILQFLSSFGAWLAEEARYKFSNIK
jgi:hypothetical protein